MKLLVLNWRDIRNPAAGGSEVLIHEMARRWVAAGDAVTLFTSRFRGAPREELIDGVRVIRTGGRLSVYWHAYRFYRAQGRGAFDLVIDVVNTVPFFTPWYVREPTVLLFNQMAREVWFYESWWPIAMIGYYGESWVLQPYRRQTVLAISESSRLDLVRLGFDSSRVHVLPLGQPAAGLPPVVRESKPTMLYVGRLKRSKRIDHCLLAFRQLRPVIGPAQLWIVGGRGTQERRRLERLAKQLGTQTEVTFFGHVPDREKLNLMARAHVLLVPSVREGWGLIVTEANAVGTPAVVYPVPGLTDSTLHEVTGLICPDQRPEALAAAVQRLLADQALYQRLSANALTRAASLTWERTASRAREVLIQRIDGVRPHA